MSADDSSGSLQTALTNGLRLLDREPVAAAEQAQAILSVTPGQPDALRLLGRALRRMGQTDDAARADCAAIEASFRAPALRSAGAALARGELAAAEHLLRDTLRQSPGNVAATLMLADVAARVGIYLEAERLLREALTLAPDYAETLVSLALVLFSQGRIDESLALLDKVVVREPGHIRAAASKADVLAQTGEYDAAAATYRALLDQVGEHAEVWMWYGHLLKTMGRQDKSVEAYRRATALDPDLAEAWWSLAELKANRIDGDDVVEMERAIANLPDAARSVFLHFALGKAYEDRQDWSRSFEHYAAGNERRLALEPHDREAVTAEVNRSIEIYDEAFFAARAGAGCPAPDPIFIVGMPRAGSTLLEQILSSHSRVEGTAELPDIPLMVQALVAGHWRNSHARYPDIVTSLDQCTIRELGERYLAAAARHRKTAAPFFIDKLPNNWRYLGFIHLILPNARIIDARRGAMACCFSNLKQHFAQGQSFAYSQTDIGAYYRDYVRSMQHIDTILPGVVHRVDHEMLLDDTEGEVRRLLTFLGLDFEEACLRPHENTRPVRTASSEQVRRPINRDAVDRWRHYEPWLDELKQALGDAA